MMVSQTTGSIKQRDRCEQGHEHVALGIRRCPPGAQVEQGARKQAHPARQPHILAARHNERANGSQQRRPHQPPTSTTRTATSIGAV